MKGAKAAKGESLDTSVIKTQLCQIYFTETLQYQQSCPSAF